MRCRPGRTNAPTAETAAFAVEHGDRSVELDALPPQVLQQLITDTIEDEIDHRAWQRVKHAEAIERQGLADLADYFLDGDATAKLRELTQFLGDH